MNLYQYVDEFTLINSGYNILAFIALSYYGKLIRISLTTNRSVNTSLFFF